jgi:hypothetical protein
MAKKIAQEIPAPKAVARRGRPKKTVDQAAVPQPTQAEERAQKAESRKKGTPVREM